ncbi:MAG TPA: Hsp20/alpha crystallin family protein [Thermomicrobiales bacterium]|jgi:HSP20 family protein|nr:Hsp20/alpha crystallin family protein [Thermomicrobiales bacterium]
MVNRTWNPISEMVSLREAMNQLLEESFIRPGTSYLTGSGATRYSFPVNAYSTPDEIKVEALLPGISQEDVQVDIDRGVLTIAAKRHGWEPAEGQQWYLREINDGQFSRSLALPFPVETDRVTASFANGVLTLTLPKAEAAKPKRIQVGTGQTREQLTSNAQ